MPGESPFFFPFQSSVNRTVYLSKYSAHWNLTKGGEQQPHQAAEQSSLSLSYSLPFSRYRPLHGPGQPLFWFLGTLDSFSPPYVLTSCNHLLFGGPYSSLLCFSDWSLFLCILEVNLFIFLGSILLHKYNKISKTHYSRCGIIKLLTDGGWYSEKKVLIPTLTGHVETDIVMKCVFIFPIFLK